MAEERWSVALAVKETSSAPSCVNGAFDRSSQNFSLESPRQRERLHDQHLPARGLVENAGTGTCPPTSGYTIVTRERTV